MSNIADNSNSNNLSSCFDSSLLSQKLRKEGLHVFNYDEVNSIDNKLQIKFEVRKIKEDERNVNDQNRNNKENDTYSKVVNQINKISGISCSNTSDTSNSNIKVKLVPGKNPNIKNYIKNGMFSSCLKWNSKQFNNLGINNVSNEANPHCVTNNTDTTKTTIASISNKNDSANNKINKTNSYSTKHTYSKTYSKDFYINNNNLNRNIINSTNTNANNVVKNNNLSSVKNNTYSKISKITQFISNTEYKNNYLSKKYNKL